MDSYSPPQSNLSTHIRAGRAATVPARLLAGTDLLIRPIRPDDADALQQGFELLSPMSRYYRFHSPLQRLPDPLVHYLTHVDGVDHVALVAFERVGLHAGAGVGVGRFVRNPSEPHSAEVALTVVDRAQGRGLGRRLLQELASAAHARGISAFTLVVLASNRRARRLLASVGAIARGSDADVITFELAVASLLDAATEAARHDA